MENILIGVLATMEKCRSCDGSGVIINNNKTTMKELTKIEIPEGGTLSIEHENEKCYAVIRGEDEPYWKKFERGDVVVTSGLMALFGTYMSEDKHNFESIVNKSIIDLPVSGWFSKYFTIATDDQKAGFFRWLREEKGLKWDGKKLVKVKASVPKEGDLCIIFNRDYSHAFIAKYVWFLDSCYDNIIKWDGTKEHYERVLRGELK